MGIDKIVIRVYGIWINANRQVLISDEFYKNTYFTKFPGGGLKLGESVNDCLKREWREELAVEIDILKHFYTTDFFQQSAFDDSAQILSIYYLVKPSTEVHVEISTAKPDEQTIRRTGQTFRWIDVSGLNENLVTYPIDKKVATMIRERLL